MSLISKKICLVGDFGVGKTSLVRRFVDRQFSDQYLSTIGVKISRKLVKLSANGNVESPDVQLVIWDVEGQTRFQAIASSYLQGAAGAIIVADLKRPETIASIVQHIALAANANPQGIAIVIALNKVDLIDETALADLLSLSQWEDRTEVVGTYTTSAKTGNDVDEIFQTLAQAMV
ncbi:MAG: GTP-binding protein [Cyanosarcina radialis HA8281-LM2]|jgi:small GTP-binding protein|nr:GTP-binding protein [Cyanosarcina radialis HA8281-LM2]